MSDKNINKEQEFMLLLQKTLKEARENGGRISRDEISEIFSGLSLDRSQLEQVEGYLKAHKIVVGTQAGDVDALPEVERDFLTSYMEMLDNIPELSDSVLEALKISAMAGEHSAQKELSEQMLRDVVDIARLYAGQGVSIEELIGAGNEALVTGVRLLGHLDSPQDVDGEIGRRIMDSMEDLIAAMLDDNAMDRKMEDMVNLVADKAHELAEELGRKVTPMELAGEGDVTAEQIMEAVRLTGGKIEDLDLKKQG
jgi:RNA polymerase primary sigma factor